MEKNINGGGTNFYWWQSLRRDSSDGRGKTLVKALLKTLCGGSGSGKKSEMVTANLACWQQQRRGGSNGSGKMGKLPQNARAGIHKERR